MTRPILIVDDDPVQRRLLQAAAVRFGHEPVMAEDGRSALAILEGERGAGIAAVVLDLVMPGLDGMGVLAAMRERGLSAPVIVQTAQGSIETAVAAMRAGAFDFVVKPAAPEKLKAAIGNAIKVGAYEGRARREEPARGPGFTFKDVAAASPAMERATALARKAANAGIAILIEGESGTGKEVLARAIRNAGPRRTKPFVTVNCGAIPENLVESILFGHEKGSFTGATQRHVGKFVEAHGGTLFLDEVGDLPLDAQVKLLRAVQEGEVQPVGARDTVKVDIRIISATHRNLAERVGQGLFREDLFYRLNVFPIAVPPLRQRREDIPFLVQYFMARRAPHEARARINGISAGAMELLKAYDWPGNVRQLENAMLRACVLCEGDRLTATDFPQIDAQVNGIGVSASRPDESESLLPAAEGAPPGPAPKTAAAPPAFGILRALDGNGNVRALAEIENEMIRFALDHYKGRMSEVARRLGIGRSTLYRKLREMGIDPEAPRGERLVS